MAGLGIFTNEILNAHDKKAQITLNANGKLTYRQRV